MKLSRLRGFTVLEILLVVVIVGILGAAAMYALNTTRAGNRDGKRASDVALIQAALTKYWLQKATYPVMEKTSLGKPGANADVLTTEGFRPKDQVTGDVLLDRMPVGPSSNEFYLYHGSSQGFSLKFETEKQTVYGTAGAFYVHSTGVDKNDIEK